MYPSDDEYPDDYDLNDDEVELLPCPSCGREVYEETEKCPYCGDWIMPRQAAARTPFWFRVVGAVVVVAFLLWFVGLIRWLL